MIVETGVNIKKDQGCVIFADVEQYEFVRIVEEQAYKSGAGWVMVNWSDQPSTKLMYNHESVETLSTVEKWEEEKHKFYVDKLPAFIHILSDDPDGLKDVDIEKMQNANIARSKVLKKYRDARENLNQWTIVAIPSEKWAKKIFPDDDTQTAVDKLWKAILNSVRISEENNPVEEWKKHNAVLDEKSRILNSHAFDYLHYQSSNGTDFKCWLIPDSVWMGGGEPLKDGTYYNPNMPTEEVFTSPMKGKCEGVVVSTMPLSYQSNIIDNFSIEFKDGRAVSCKAEKGEALLKKMISMDNGAAMLGELALVPHDSPISNSGILFYNTLFDENASCHIALGRGFDNTIIGYENLSKDEIFAAGINDSIIHVDFMIG